MSASLRPRDASARFAGRRVPAKSRYQASRGQNGRKSVDAGISRIEYFLATTPVRQRVPQATDVADHRMSPAATSPLLSSPCVFGRGELFHLPRSPNADERPARGIPMDRAIGRSAGQPAPERRTTLRAIAVICATTFRGRDRGDDHDALGFCLPQPGQHCENVDRAGSIQAPFEANFSRARRLLYSLGRSTCSTPGWSR